MQLRKLTPDDAPLFRQLRAEMCRLHPEAFGQTPDEVIAMPDQTFLDWMSPNDAFPQRFVLSAWDNGTLVGTVAFRREDSIKEQHRGYIWSVYVKDTHRGKGISKELMQRVIDESRRIDGIEMLVLSVATTQTAARQLYLSLGFQVYGTNHRGYKLPDGRYVDHDDMMLLFA